MKFSKFLPPVSKHKDLCILSVPFGPLNTIDCSHFGDEKDMQLRSFINFRTLPLLPRQDNKTFKYFPRNFKFQKRGIIKNIPQSVLKYEIQKNTPHIFLRIYEIKNLLKNSKGYIQWCTLYGVSDLPWSSLWSECPQSTTLMYRITRVLFKILVVFRVFIMFSKKKLTKAFFWIEPGNRGSFYTYLNIETPFVYNVEYVYM